MLANGDQTHGEDAQLLGGPGNLVELDGDVGADIFYEVHLFC